ncbi:MAG: SxtJ family membrane protein [Melioribacter sp.]|uniref:SxtJ family membrane protein n=1 Tax=Rosettibacter primus TaxID=3111523 RepID=UPI00247C5BAA|nr:SxtJ family membrane protein [Melioribacter sp.]
MILEEIKNIDCSKRALKKFGFTFAVISFLISIISFLNHSKFFFYFILAGLLLLVISISIPQSLKYIYKIWMTFALILGIITTNLILTILFYAIITPIGLIIKLRDKDLLDLKFKKDSNTYWNYRKIKEYKREYSERQF